MDEGWSSPLHFLYFQRSENEYGKTSAIAHENLYDKTRHKQKILKLPYPLLEQPYLDPRILLSEVCVDFGPLVDYLPDFGLGHQWEGEVRSRMEAHDLAGPVGWGRLKQWVRVRS